GIIFLLLTIFPKKNMWTATVSGQLVQVTAGIRFTIWQEYMKNVSRLLSHIAVCSLWNQCMELPKKFFFRIGTQAQLRGTQIKKMLNELAMNLTRLVT